MTPTEIIAVAGRVYPDRRILEQWDPETERPRPEGGDTLADFVIREIRDSYDPAMTDAAQLATAAKAIDRAIRELTDVHNELLCASVDQALADWSARSEAAGD